MRNPSPSVASDLACLAWQIELGAVEAIGDVPVNRFVSEEPSLPVRAAPPAGPESVPESVPESIPVPEAPGTAALAAGCARLEDLRAAMAGFDGCALKAGARSLVFADGNPAARLMVIGEAPGRDEDIAGRPFVGRSGQLLDRMLAAIGLSRRSEDPAAAVYITNTLPWRPPQNREPSADEVAMMLPFLHRHIELAAPEVLLLVGSAAVRTLLQTGEGITRMRGRWLDWSGVPVMATFHPAALLRDGTKKRAAWADLLAVKVRLDAG